MKPSLHLLLTFLFLALFSFTSQSQKNKAKYTDFDRGYRYWYYENYDSAFLMFDRYVNNADDTLRKATAYKYLGEMQWNINDFYASQESLTAALHSLNPSDTAHHAELGIVYNLLGNVSQHLERYDEALGFYNKALTFVGASPYRYELMNGKATALQKMGNYQAAIAVYDAVLAKQPGDAYLLARIIDNRAKTRWLQDPGAETLPEFWQALQIRIDSQYTPTLNASYAHLSDYYAKPNPDSALWYADQMLHQATQNKSPEDVLEAIDKLIRLSPSPASKEEWYRQYKNINDSLQLSRDTTRYRYALIRYDVQKSKADNLQLQQHITRQQLYLYGLMLLAVAILAGGYAWYNKRRKRMKEEAANAIRNARLKTSQKVHDVVANGLYGIMNELEHRNTMEPNKLITKIEDLYEKSRNISYEEIAPAETVAYDRQVHDLLSDFANDTTKVLIIGNQPAFWNNLNSKQKTELQLTLNELMVNMKKHSQAKNVVIQFRQENNAALIRYKDDGLGFRANVQFGNGLQNTVTRINSLQGAVNFEKSDKAGVSIAISFPLQSANHD